MDRGYPFRYGNNVSNAQDILSYFDYHEFTDPVKKYEKESFLFDYGKGVKEYRWIFLKINGIDFAVVQQVIGSEAEFETISRNCQCRYCLLPWFNPARYFPYVDLDCIKDRKYDGWRIYDPLVIEKTRVHIKKNQLDTK